MSKKNQLVIQFKMNSEDYNKWKNGDEGVTSEHQITSYNFNSVLAAAGKFAPFQHIKNDYTEIEIVFYEKDLTNLLMFSLEIMNMND